MKELKETTIKANFTFIDHQLISWLRNRVIRESFDFTDSVKNKLNLISHAGTLNVGSNLIPKLLVIYYINKYRYKVNRLLSSLVKEDFMKHYDNKPT